MPKAYAHFADESAGDACEDGDKITLLAERLEAGAQRFQGRQEERKGCFRVCPGFVVFLKLRARSSGL